MQMKYIKDFFFKHIEQQGSTYQRHFCFGLVAGVALIVAGIASIIHAIFPAVLASFSEQTCKNLIKKNELRNKK